VATALLLHCEHILLSDGACGQDDDSAHLNQNAPDKPNHATSVNRVGSSSSCAPVQNLRLRLVRPLSEQRSNKARLLHYYPTAGDSATRQDAWCGWHFDHGTLTGLTAAMFLPSNAPGADFSAAHELASPDSNVGLHVCTAEGDIVRITSQRDQLLFQAGQCLEILSGGRFRATQHCVYGPLKPLPVSRNTFAVFCQPKCALLCGFVHNCQYLAVKMPCIMSAACSAMCLLAWYVACSALFHQPQPCA
jgi:hypothetical protein